MSIQSHWAKGETPLPPEDDSMQRYPGAAKGWWAVSIFAVSAVLSYTDRQILALLVAPIQGDLGISDVQLSVLQGAAFAVLYSVIGLPIGRVADLVPRRALLIFAVVMWSIGTIACGYSHSFAELFGARLLVGMGEAALAPAAMSLIADFFPQSTRALPTGVFFTGMVGGSAIAIGGMLLNAAQHAAFANIPALGALAPWREVLVILGIFGFVVAALFFTIREPGGRSASMREVRSRLLAPGDIFRAFRGQYALLLPLYAAMAIGSIVDYAVLSWTPALLTRRFGLSPAEIGASLGGVAITAGVTGTPSGGWLGDWIAGRYGFQARINVCCAILLIAALLVSPVGMFATSTMTLASVFFWIFASSMSGTIGIVATLDLLPHESRGLGTATIAFCNTLIGLGLGPTLVALATDRLYRAPGAVGLSLSTVVAPAIALCFLCFLVAARAMRRVSAIAA